MHTNLRLKPLCTILLLFSQIACLAASENYRISEVFFRLEKTKQSALEKKIDINTKRIFSSEDELNDYIAEIKQQLINTRTFDTIEITSSVSEKNSEEGATSGENNSSGSSDSIKEIAILIEATDSKHLLILPYPKYDSNQGFTFKIKTKDTNFAGTMSELNFDVNCGMKEDEYEEGSSKPAFGFNFNYDYPFNIASVNSVWKNNIEFEYLYGRKKPEFSAETGFTFELPFNNFSLLLDLSQSAHYDLEYKEYSDELYASSKADFSLPVKLGDISTIQNIVWAPFVNCIANYDANKIHVNNDDLSSPLLSFGHRLSSQRVNWYGNFRTGYSAVFSQAMGYDFLQEKFKPRMDIDLALFKSFRYFGINTKFKAFFSINNRQKIGSYLRGIKDDQKYGGTTAKALKVPAALILNLDIPIHIITTDWASWIEKIFGPESSANQKLSWMRKLDFEMQFSPFIDAALTRNEYTENNFYIRDGWYSGGLEVLVFPKKYRSIVVRASAGIDIGKMIISKHTTRFYDDSWREEDVSKKELYVGIGLHY